MKSNVFTYLILALFAVAGAAYYFGFFNHTPMATEEKNELSTSQQSVEKKKEKSESPSKPQTPSSEVNEPKPIENTELKVPPAPEVLPSAKGHPFIACTSAELDRLQKAWKEEGLNHEAVKEAIESANSALSKEIEFPIRGGQHAQWYQCDRCQIALKTVENGHQCPKCGKIYTGSPYDDVIFLKKHHENLKRMISCAWAYAVTGDEKYAAYASKILLGYAERYLQYPLHAIDLKTPPNSSAGHIFAQTLDEAYCMALEIGPAYDLIWNSEALKESDHQAIEKNLILPLLQNLEKHRTKTSNWQTYHNAAMIVGGALLKDDAWVQKAIHDPENGFYFQIKEAISIEGMWHENSWGYHFYTMEAMTAIAETARRMGIDLWKEPALQKMYLLPVQYSMVNGSLPRFGDDVNSRVTKMPDQLEVAYHAFHAPELEPLLPQVPIFQTVMFGREVSAKKEEVFQGSHLFRGAGHAILRTLGEPSLSAALTFGPYGGFHGHFDKLSFVLYGYQQELGVDPGRAAAQAYRLPIHGNWYKATVGHNAIVVDGNSQQPVEGAVDFFESTPTDAVVMTHVDGAYEGVKMKRMLYLSPRYLVVMDEVVADRAHRIDWIYHNRGTGAKVLSESGEEESMEGGTLPQGYQGAEYMERLKKTKLDRPFQVRFSGGDVLLSLTSSGSAGTEVFKGDGVGASVEDRVPLVILSRQTDKTRFVTVFEPLKKGAQPLVREVSVKETESGCQIQIRREDGNDELNLDAANKVEIMREGKKVLSASPKSEEGTETKK
ncbi:MAG: heparinase II/III family protein [Verrucomicrobiota bacterium]